MITQTNKDDLVLGIDIGSSRSAVAYVDPVTKKIHDVGKSNKHQKSFESIAGFDEEGKIITCKEAGAKRLNKNCMIFSNLKRALVENKRLDYNGVLHRPLYLLAQILKRLKSEAEKQIGYQVKKAIVTVPAYFEEIHKAAIRKAASLAGLDVLKLINEPTAAVVTYCNTIKKASGSLLKEVVLILDAGGFTFDASLCQIDNTVIDVIATHGDYSAGNRLIDQNIKALILEEYEKKFNLKPELSHIDTINVDQISETIKIKASANGNYSESQSITIGSHSFDFKLSRTQLLATYKPYLERLKRVITTILNKAHLKPNKILLVGGPANSKLFVSLLEDFLPYKIDLSLDPINSVARGAAIHGYALTKGRGSSQILLDVLPISLGVEKLGLYCHKMLYKNSKIPCSHKETFSTYEDYQKKVKIKVLQGEDQMAENCVELGTIVLDNIERAKKGIPKFVVNFEVNSSGLLTVTAEDQTTKDIKKLDLQCENRVSDAELEEMRSYASNYEREDTSHMVKLQLVKDTQLTYVELCELLTKIGNTSVGVVYANDLKNSKQVLDTELKRYPKDYPTLMELLRSARALIEEVTHALPEPSTDYLSLAAT